MPKILVQVNFKISWMHLCSHGEWKDKHHFLWSRKSCSLYSHSIKQINPLIIIKRKTLGSIMSNSKQSPGTSPSTLAFMLNDFHLFKKSKNWVCVHACVCTHVHTHVTALTWKSENNFGMSVCSFHHVGQEAHTGSEWCLVAGAFLNYWALLPAHKVLI